MDNFKILGVKSDASYNEILNAFDVKRNIFNPENDPNCNNKEFIELRDAFNNIINSKREIVDTKVEEANLNQNKGPFNSIAMAKLRFVRQIYGR